MSGKYLEYLKIVDNKSRFLGVQIRICRVQYITTQMRRHGAEQPPRADGRTLSDGRMWPHGKVNRTVIIL